MSPTVIITAVEAFLKSPAGRKLLADAASAIASKASSNNSIGNNNSSSIGNNSSNSNSYDNDDGQNGMSQSKKLDMLREAVVGDPEDYLIRGGLGLAAGLTRGIGNISTTNANHLAQAILSANRTNSARQNDLYGPSRKEKASNVWAQEKTRRGENVRNITDEVSDVISNINAIYGQREDAARTMQAQEILDAPGNFYNYLNSLQRANYASNINKSYNKRR